MSTRLHCWAAVLALSLACVGCQAVQCGDGCGRGNSMAFQKYDCSCADGCGASGTQCGDDCECGTPCGQNGCGAGGRFARDRIAGCTGCGEMYWSEWHNDPPRVCEPCDCLGNYTGPGSESYYRAPYRTANRVATRPAPSAEPMKLVDEAQQEAEFLR